MKNRVILGLIVTLVMVAFGGYPVFVSAQMEDDTTTEVEIEATTTENMEDEDATTTEEETDTEDEEVMTDDDIVIDFETITEDDVEVPELSDEELEAIADSSIEITGEDLGEDPLIGVVIGVTDNEVIIRTQDGQTIRLAIDVNAKVNYGGRSVDVKDLKAGNKVVIGGENSEVKTGEVKVATAGSVTISQGGKDKTYDTAGARVVRNGRNASTSDLQEGDTITFVVDADGNLQLVDATSSDDMADDNSSMLWWIILGAIVVILAVYGYMRSRQSTSM